MVVCPECGYPYVDEAFYVVGARDIKCDNCTWSGSSSQLLLSTMELDTGVEAMQEFYLYFGKKIAPQIASKAIQLGLMSGEGSKENITKIARVLSRITRVSFKEFVEAILDNAKADTANTADTANEDNIEEDKIIPDSANLFDGGETDGIH